MTRQGLLCKVVDLSTSHSNWPTSLNSMGAILRASCWLRYGDWKLALCRAMLTENSATDILLSYKRATEAEVPNNYRAWHSWALINFRCASEQICGAGDLDAKKSSAVVRSHVIAAVKGFTRAISLGTKRWSASVQQDMLNLLSCLFEYGEMEDVAVNIKEGVSTIKIEAWLGVLPQLLARIHIKSPAVRSVLHPLLVRIGTKHPQALMYPLSVLIKSPVSLFIAVYFLFVAVLCASLTTPHVFSVRSRIAKWQRKV